MSAKKLMMVLKFLRNWLKNSRWAEISVFLMVVKGCIYTCIHVCVYVCVCACVCV
jgi:hypothetical protein